MYTRAPDKHREHDTAELVQRAAGAQQVDSGRVEFHGGGGAGVPEAVKFGDQKKKILFHKCAIPDREEELIK